MTLEGIDGCGKSTQAALLADHLEASGHEVVCLREPGGTAVSEKIRQLLLDPVNDEMADECELLLYEASRAQLVRQVIEPALERGAVVVCDRYFDSTYAYQHGGRGLDRTLVERCNELGSCGRRPDVTLVFDLDPTVAFDPGGQGPPRGRGPAIPGTGPCELPRSCGEGTRPRARHRRNGQRGRGGQARPSRPRRRPALTRCPHRPARVGVPIPPSAHDGAACPRDRRRLCPQPHPRRSTACPSNHV